MSTTLLELKKQASFFFREKIKSARLALTDVTPVELSAEEATDDNCSAPDTRTLWNISRASFEVDDYMRVVGILHKRFLKFDSRNWRSSYNSLILLDHLLTYGPESVAEEFQSDKHVIEDMESFKFVDEKGFDWGMSVRKKSERVLKLLEKGSYYTEERERSRKLTKGIKGFGSFSLKASSVRSQNHASGETYGRSISLYEDEIGSLSPCDERLTKVASTQKMESMETKLNFSRSYHYGQKLQADKSNLEEKVTPITSELHKWSSLGETDKLL